MTAPSTTELTFAEQCVAELAAAGRTNAQIARYLHITVSTVEQHLTHTYQKLGIGGRSQLAQALADTTGGTQ